MMGEHHEQKDLFSYQVDLDKRVRKNNPLRVIKESISFEWVRDEVRRFYGYNGHVSVDPVIIVKLLFLLFYDNVNSERELMRIVPERLDYLWFLGLGIDDNIPDHSVLSKARARGRSKGLSWREVAIVSPSALRSVVVGDLPFKRSIWDKCKSPSRGREGLLLYPLSVQN